MISASILAGTPFRKSLSAHLPHARSNDSLIPDTLTRPVNILFLGIDNSGHPHSQDPTHTQALAGNSDTILLVRLMPTYLDIFFLGAHCQKILHTALIYLYLNSHVQKLLQHTSSA